MRTIAVLSIALVLAGCAAPGPDPETRTWTCDPCAAPIPDVEAPVWEPSADASPLDRAHVVVAYRDGSANTIVTSVTRDAGRTWERGILAVGEDAPASSPAREWTHTGDAVVAIGPDGVVRLAGLGFRLASDAAGASYEREGASIFVATSRDGGLTFPDVSVVAPGGGTQYAAANTPASLVVQYRNEDKEWLAIAPDGTMLVVWTALHPGTGALGAYPQREPNTLYASLSKDGGASWSTPVAVETEGSPSGAYPLFAPDGAMHVAYRYYDEPRSFVATSRDGGATWDKVEVGRAMGQPLLEALPDGTLLLAFPAAAGSDASEPTIARSSDGGRTWSAPLALGAESPGRAHVALDVAPDGTAYVGWYGEEGGGAYRVAVLRGDEAPTTLDVGPAEAPWERYGDYVTGLTALSDGFLAVWNDDASGGPKLQSARYTLR